MRHVFVVFSGITRLSTLATIDTLRLDKSDVTILLGREQPPIDGFTCHSIRPVPMRLGRNFVRFRYQLRQFDAWIRELAQGQPLAVYLPGLFSEHLYALATDPAVVSVNLIEEGLGSLMRQTRVYGRRAGGHSRLASLGARGRFPAHLADCSHMLDRAFHFTPEAFPDWRDSSRVLMQWPALDSPLQHADLRAVISVETLAEAGHFDIGSYSEKLSAIVAMVQGQFGDPVGVKFHPGVTKPNQRIVAARLATAGSAVRMLPTTLTMESLMRSGGPVIVGAATSSLHYAIMAGSNAMTYVGLIDSPALDRRFQRLHDSLPDSSRSAITHLTN